jgi:hypothetical protein
MGDAKTAGRELIADTTRNAILDDAVYPFLKAASKP